MELEGPMKASWNRHYLLYLDEQKNANFGQIVDRFLVKIGVATMAVKPVIFSKTEKKNELRIELEGSMRRVWNRRQQLFPEI